MPDAKRYQLEAPLPGNQWAVLDRSPNPMDLVDFAYRLIETECLMPPLRVFDSWHSEVTWLYEMPSDRFSFDIDREEGPALDYSDSEVGWGGVA